MFIKTKHEGLYYRLNKLKQKVFIARYKIDGKETKKVIGKEPQYNLITAFQARQKLIDEHNDIKEPDTLLDAFENYIATFESIRNDKWAMGKRGELHNHLALLHDKKPSEVTRSQCQMCVMQMLKKGLNPSTVGLCISSLTAFYNHYNSIYDTHYMPTAKVEIPKANSNRDLCLSIEQIQKLVRAIKECPDDNFRLFMMFILTGRRRRETMLLEYRDIDIANMKYTIRANTAKTRTTYDYPLTQMIVDEIVIGEGRIFSFTPIMIDKRFRWLKQAAGIDGLDFHLHDMRHIIGTIAVNNGLSLEHIGKALGHTSVTTTKRYSNVRLIQATNVVESVLNTIS